MGQPSGFRPSKVMKAKKDTRWWTRRPHPLRESLYHQANLASCSVTSGTVYMKMVNPGSRYFIYAHKRRWHSKKILDNECSQWRAIFWEMYGWNRWKKVDMNFSQTWRLSGAPRPGAVWLPHRWQRSMWGWLIVLVWGRHPEFQMRWEQGSGRYVPIIRLVERQKKESPRGSQHTSCFSK